MFPIHVQAQVEQVCTAQNIFDPLSAPVQLIRNTAALTLLVFGIFVIVSGLLSYAVRRYRRKVTDDIAVTAAVAGMAHAEDYPVQGIENISDPRSAPVETLYRLSILVGAVCAAIFVIDAGLLTNGIIRYGRRCQDRTSSSLWECRDRVGLDGSAHPDCRWVKSC